MIHMHHEVANLELLDLLEREGHLTTAGLVAAEVVFVEAVEDLVVGEHADAEVAIDETLVEGVLDGNDLRGKRILGIRNFPHLRENIADALVLLLTVGTDVYLVALRQIVGKGLLEQVEME